MAEEIKRFNFNQVAADLGYVAEDGPGGPGGRPAGGPGGPGGKPAGGPPQFPTDPESIRRNSLRFQKMWPDERSMALQDYFNDYVASGEPIEFEGHSICWAMIALQQKLRANKVLMYMPPFGKSLDLVPMQRVAEPKDNPMMRFDVTEQGNYVIAFYCAAAEWSDCIIGQLSLAANSFVATGLDHTATIDATKTSDVWYSLDGRRIETITKPGLYISNGKIVLKK